ncbi:MAG TPA: tetratricopeptide repeat protein, partial [Candidatus Polarisedimenticolia bacterium]|nr:tetratricopeptide repeat protein [Candidatus Polarisedimenticolia bacterium]
MPRPAPSGIAAVLGAALLLLGTEAITRETDPPVSPRAPEPELDASRQPGDEGLEEAAERVARAQVEHGPLSEELAQALAGQAFLLWGVEDYAAGRPLAERALAIRLGQGAETSRLAGSRYQVADFRRATGDYAGALEQYGAAIATWARVPGEAGDGPAAAWHYMGVVRGLTGDLEGARTCLLRALALRERALGASDKLVATTLQALADLAARTGDPGAEGLFARAQRIWERTLGPTDPFIARSLLARARLLAAAGDLEAARPLVARALSIRVAAFGPRHHLVAQARFAEADLLARSGDQEAALAESEEALAILEERHGPSHPEVAAALADRARMQWRAGRRSDALVTALAAEKMA